MLTILIQREKEYQNVIKSKQVSKDGEGSTVGSLKIIDDKGENIFSCFTLENAGASTDESGKDKRIIARNYKLEWTSTNVAVPKEYNGRGLLLTCDDILPSFRKRRILIHIGNYPQYSFGFILLGMINKDNGMIEQSTNAVRQFYNIINHYGADNFTLIIKEIE